MRWLDGITNSVGISLSMGDGEGQGSLACCSPWGHKELNMTEQEGLEDLFHVQGQEGQW